MSATNPDDLEANRSCISKVCTGDAACPVNVICCPAVLTFNACDIYCIPMLLDYLFLVLDTVFCVPFRLICCACCWRHTDHHFPANHKSIGEWDGMKGKELDETIGWTRAGKYFTDRLTEEQKQNGVRVKLFDDGIQPEDVAQGQLGNCWLIAAMACLAEHPGLLRKVFKSSRAQPNGKYDLRLYDGQKKKWKNVTVDDHIPVFKKDNSLLFANPQGNELWVILLEKAFAKFCGSYSALAGGHTVWAFHTVTGDPVYALKRNDDNDRWSRQNLKMTNDESNKRAMSFYQTDESYSSEDTFFLLRKLCRIRTLLGAAISNDGEMKRQDGLVAGHAYSVLDARSFSTADGRINLVELRNPWGAHEWNGAWSDKSGEWDKYPGIRDAIKPQGGNDGKFWISWTDFASIYSRIDVCQRSTGLRDLHLDVKEADGCAHCVGPCLGCCEGCAGYWCKCRGCRALYCDVKAQKETAAIGPTGSDDSMLVQFASAVGGGPEGEEMDR